MTNSILRNTHTHTYIHRFKNYVNSIFTPCTMHRFLSRLFTTPPFGENSHLDKKKYIYIYLVHFNVRHYIWKKSADPRFLDKMLMKALKDFALDIAGSTVKCIINKYRKWGITIYLTVIKKWMSVAAYYTSSEEHPWTFSRMII